MKKTTILVKPNMVNVQDPERVSILQKNKASITKDKRKVIARKQKYKIVNFD